MWVRILLKTVLCALVVLAASVGCFLLMASRISPFSSSIIGGWTWSYEEIAGVVYIAGLYVAANVVVMIPWSVRLRRSQMGYVVVSSIVAALAWGVLFGLLWTMLPHWFDNGTGDAPQGIQQYLALSFAYACFSIVAVMCSCHIVWPIAFGELWLLRRIIYGPVTPAKTGWPSLLPRL